MDFFLAGDGATRRGEGCSGLEIPLARFELERTREQKNLIPQSARLGVDILSRFLNVYHRRVARATQALFSSDAQLRSCHKCFSHYRQPPSLHQSVLIFERFAAANAKTPNYDPSTPPNVTQHYRAILECSKLNMLVWAWYW